MPAMTAPDLPQTIWRRLPYLPAVLVGAWGVACIAAGFTIGLLIAGKLP